MRIKYSSTSHIGKRDDNLQAIQSIVAFIDSERDKIDDQIMGKIHFRLAEFYNREATEIDEMNASETTKTKQQIK